MASSLEISSLVPRGLIVESVNECEDAIEVTVRSETTAAACPSCGSGSQRVHSRYLRRVADLPCTGRRVSLSVITRRFFCRAEKCRQRIFVERFGEALPPRARRTSRLDGVVHYLGLALGGRPAASFARRLMLPVSNDTLLRVVRRRAQPMTEPLRVVGIDDWAFRRNHRYGSIVGSWLSCQIVRSPPSKLGWPGIPRSRSCRATAVVVTEAATIHIRSLITRLRVVNRELRDATHKLDELCAGLDEAPRGGCRA